MKTRWKIPVIVFLSLLAVPLPVVGFFYAADLLGGVTAPYRTSPYSDPALGAEWMMHPVDNPGDWLPNGLSAADVNGDGWDDYLTNYEFTGRIRVALHPGGGDPGLPWAAMDLGYFPDAESAAFGDLDGDGKPDVVVAHGMEHTGAVPGVRVLWGDGTAWEDAGDLPASLAGWQFLYIQTADLDLDGDVDIIAGGRAARVAAEGQRDTAGDDLVWAGIRWFENPGGSTNRDLSAWDMHVIDADTKSGHGFVIGDIDGDGDPDIANANADWDTPEDEENVAWYQNPGTGAARQPWHAEVLYTGSEFYGKEQVAIADLDGDGLVDILTQTPQEFLWFRNRGGQPPAFAMESIPKPDALQWRARPLVLADLTKDGAPEIIAALIHNDGRLPKDKPAVFYLQRVGEAWVTHVIKWGDGFLGLGTFNGEKWDQFIPADVDGDGDLDLVANCEEYNRLRAVISVVWFENPLPATQP